MGEKRLVLGRIGSIFTLTLDLEPKNKRFLCSCALANDERGTIHYLVPSTKTADRAERLDILLNIVYDKLTKRMPDLEFYKFICVVHKVQSIAKEPLHPHDGYLNHPSFHYSWTINKFRAESSQVEYDKSDICPDGMILTFELMEA